MTLSASNLGRYPTRHSLKAMNTGGELCDVTTATKKTTSMALCDTFLKRTVTNVLSGDSGVIIGSQAASCTVSNNSRATDSQLQTSLDSRLGYSVLAHGYAPRSRSTIAF